MSHLLTDQFLAAKRYGEILHGEDGKHAFQKAVDQFTRSMNSLGKDNPMRAQLEKSLRQFTVTQGAHYFEALAGSKRTQDGKDLAGKILEFDSSQTTRTLLANAAQRAGNADLAQYVSH